MAFRKKHGLVQYIVDFSGVSIYDPLNLRLRHWFSPPVRKIAHPNTGLIRQTVTVVESVKPLVSQMRFQ